MESFDWHGGTIAAATPIDVHYRNTQNVRRFLLHACGPDFTFDRDLMAWIGAGNPATMGDVANEWLRRRGRAHIKNHASPEQRGKEQP